MQTTVKKFLVPIILLLLCLSVAAEETETAEKKAPRPPMSDIAVHRIESSDTGTEGMPTELLNLITGELRRLSLFNTVIPLSDNHSKTDDDTANNIEADYFITGTIESVGAVSVFTLFLINTDTGRVVAQGRVRATKSPSSDTAQQLVHALFSDAGFGFLDISELPSGTEISYESALLTTVNTSAGAIALNPGSRTFTIDPPNRDSYSVTALIETGTIRTVSGELQHIPQLTLSRENKDGQQIDVAIMKGVVTYRPYKWAGIGLAAGGALLVFSGFGFDAAALSQFREYKDMMDIKSLEQAKANDRDPDSYINRANTYRDRGNVYKSLRTVSWITGGVLVAGGVVLAVIPREKKIVKEIRVFFSGDTVYGGISFDF